MDFKMVYRKFVLRRRSIKNILFVGAFLLAVMALNSPERPYFRITIQFYSSNHSNMVGEKPFSVKPITYPRANSGPTVCNITVHDKMDLMKMKKPNFIKRFKNPCWYERNKVHCLPYMYLVGVAKCGTTDLFKRITLHPYFVAPTTKEPNWLSAGRFWRNESVSYYTLTFFTPLSKKLQNSKKPGLITGEASINTLEGSHFWPYLGSNVGHDEPVENNAEYIYHMNSQARILINLRNPVDRLWSEYLAFSKNTNKSAEIFHQIVEKEVSIYNTCLRYRTLRSCMYDRPLAQFSTTKTVERQSTEQLCNFKPMDIVMLRRGVYHVFIKDYLKVFPRDHVLIQRLEDISDDPKGTLIRTFNFLGLKIPTKRQFRNIMGLDIRNTRKPAYITRGGMLEATRRILHDFYKPHNDQLSILLNDTKYNYGPTG